MQQAVNQHQDREFEFSNSHFRFLAELASSKTGIVLPENKKDMVYGRLVRRLRALELNNFDEYCELIKSDEGEEELPHLINAITTNLTRFFRESHHFEHLKKVISEMASASRTGRIRLWSAACSSGMEPYSMAMVMRSAIPNIEAWDARILATDIDSNMLRTGAAGRYAERDAESVPKEYQKYVERDGEHIHMSNLLKNLIAFKHLNLLDEPWPMKGTFDAIFCRNVVIYFDKPTKQRLFDRMAGYLKPDGLLYIGHSENLHGISDRFELLGRTVYRRVR